MKKHKLKQAKQQQALQAEPCFLPIFLLFGLGQGARAGYGGVPYGATPYGGGGAAYGTPYRGVPYGGGYRSGITPYGTGVAPRAYGYGPGPGVPYY
ncbi:MAG TPA: hypothetical protein VFV52_08525 [Bacilli bacterium]|nr:hypothetical protein [Bacilli bacterium]